eukprot:TRINITY_DN13812_c0_g1_i2.p1 TRINITY_DN13812_c0_g1~~TRINITY_DN13812_c0_g1_i2.p1  ORF type:complete len:221 (-),score=61.41 TRINITY_DN13812_c0_g1_i2:100-762(-)
MNTMDELKNLVLQTLEAKGVLGPIRAKLRTCVFKVVEQEDANLRETGSYLENPLAARLTESEEGLICAEIIRDFLEFYKMDYTLQIFGPECNLPAQNNVKDKLPQLLGVNKARMPLLTQLVQMARRSVADGAPPRSEERNAREDAKIMANPKKPQAVSEELEVEEVPEDIENAAEDDDKGVLGASAGFTGSASIALDPSVDSVVLQEFDYVEPIEKVSQS